MRAFLMKQGGGERAERIEWNNNNVSFIVDVVGCSHFAHIHRSRRSKRGHVEVEVKTQRKAKKGEPLYRPQLQRMEVLEAQNWTRWRVWPGAFFCAR